MLRTYLDNRKIRKKDPGQTALPINGMNHRTNLFLTQSSKHKAISASCSRLPRHLSYSVFMRLETSLRGAVIIGCEGGGGGGGFM